MLLRQVHSLDKYIKKETTTMTDGMLSAADVAAVTRNNDGCNDMCDGCVWFRKEFSGK